MTGTPSVDGTASSQEHPERIPDDVPRGSRATLRDVARVAGVTPSTVSRALDPSKRDLVNEATRARIRAVVEELDYRPNLGARNLRRGRTMTVGVVVPDLANPIFAPFTRGIAHALEPSGHLPLLADTQDDHDRLLAVLERFVERRVVAIVVAAGRETDAAALMDVNSRGIPVISAIRCPPGVEGVTTVRHADADGVALAVQHLHDLGHRRVAQVRGPLDIEPFPTRAAAFDAAIQKLGLISVREAPPTEEIALADARRAADELLRGDDDSRPTAIFVPNDTMSLGALDAIRNAGLRCPEDVSVVSYNDVFFAPYVNPPLTAVHLPVYEIGQICGELAMRPASERRGTVERGSPPPVLKVRGSTAPVSEG